MSVTALLYMPLAREELATPRPHGQTAASFRRAELIRNLPALRDHVSREWCPVHRRYARELTQFDSLERASSPAALAKMCPNPGTSGYSCNILRIWRTLVPAVVSGMRALGVWPAWGGGSEGNGMSLYTCAALREECMHTACTHTICTPHAHRICTPHAHSMHTLHVHVCPPRIHRLCPQVRSLLWRLTLLLPAPLPSCQASRVRLLHRPARRKAGRGEAARLGTGPCHRCGPRAWRLWTPTARTKASSLLGRNLPPQTARHGRLSTTSAA